MDGIIIKSFEEFNSRLLFDTENFKMIKSISAADYNYQGEYKDIDGGRLFFYRWNNSLKIVFNNKIMDIDDLKDLKLNRTEGSIELVFLNSKLEKNILTERIEDNYYSNDFTMNSMDDNSFLELIFNVWNNKKKQEIIYN